MKRNLLFFASSLSFYPMALGSYSALANAMTTKLTSPLEDVSSAALLSIPKKEIKDLVTPLFVSPKHDGIRLVSHVGSDDANIGSTQDGKQTQKRVNTCFSRFGRPLPGLFWIEEELALLRRLACDAHLTLDGELYVHKQFSGRNVDGIASLKESSSKGNKCPRVKGNTTRKRDTDMRRTGDVVPVTEGFAAVSALSQKLRSNSFCPTSLKEVQTICPVVPRYCVFDIVEYEPNNDAMLKMNECDRQIQKAVMSQCGISNLQQLTVKPNHSPFSQRLRTMSFLFNMLTLKSCRAKEPETKSEVERMFHYRGGHYVQMIPYRILPLISDAEVVLRQYNKIGYEGVVVRTALNRYHTKKKTRSGNEGFRSATAVKLLPYFEDEFVVLNVAKGVNGSFWGLECATRNGHAFRVALPAAMDNADRSKLMEQLRGSRADDLDIVGLFVTLQFPSLMNSGIPRFPKVKGLRGGSGWLL